MRNIEAIFGGVLALVVLGVALFAVMNTNFASGNGGSASAVTPTTSSGSVTAPTLTAVSGQDLVCECYDAAFQMAGQVDVLSPEYRTGFQQCRARGGVDAGDAWTAGWNSRLSGRPYEASCRSYKRRR
ncbi:hypothetical protein [Hyphococcus sp.]|uniref:hypothetical protein n=1 Tax=Hyphococcus sp. TaxID=2038636 RepID=UPI002082385F|nr:MAG: hypothetical protein DHS20C04_23400 [Marinicaulis sp.]